MIWVKIYMRPGWIKMEDFAGLRFGGKFGEIFGAKFGGKFGAMFEDDLKKA